MGCNYICPVANVQEIESVPDTGYAPFNFPVDGGVLPFYFTNETFTKVLSALINGAAVTYGDEADQVVWYFLQNVEYPIEVPMTCEAIIECVDEDGDTQHAIEHMLEHNDEFQDFLNEWIAEHPGGTPTKKGEPVDPTIPITVPQPGECDLDLLYGQCLGLVQTANRMVGDFLEKWETYTNKGEVISDMVNAVPLLSELAQASGVSGVLEYANDLVDSIAENYTADYTLEYEIALACELFCAAQDADCKVTVGMFADTLNARIDNSLNLTNMVELIVSLTDQDITGINVADLYLAFFADTIAVANLVIPVTWGLETLLSVMYALNEPNDDWTTECDDCPTPPTGCFEFAAGLQSWTTYDDAGGQWEDGLGIGQNLNTYLTILAPLGSTEEVASLQVKFYRAWGGANDFDKFFIQIANSDLTNAQTFGGSALLYGGTDFTFTSTGDPWIRPRVQIAAGGITFPPNGSNPTPQYVTEICFNPE